MTDISDQAVWAVCKLSFPKCAHCGPETSCHKGERASIEAIVRAVSKHPVGLPEGWVKGP